MGLTIHYNLAYRGTDARAAVEKVRQLAMDLPFEKVGEIVTAEGGECDFEARRAELQATDATEEQQSLSWMLIQASTHIKCPWNPHASYRVKPIRLIGFTIYPGSGCEAANIGLCQYPDFIEVEYDPKQDRKFMRSDKQNGGWPRFSIEKFSRWADRQPGQPGTQDLKETRKVPLKGAAWRWGSFCKTQYANDPTCGGVANFLRCHISVVTLLERAAEIKGLRVTLNDEGHYGPAIYTDDPSAKKPKYTPHPGLYSPAALAREVGEWDTMVAAMAGAMKDAIGGQVAAPIMDYPNFEALEFRGAQAKEIKPFLAGLADMAAKVAAANPEAD